MPSCNSYPGKVFTLPANGKFEYRPLSNMMRKAFNINGDNMIAVHCHGEGKKQKFDLDLAVRVAI